MQRLEKCHQIVEGSRIEGARILVALGDSITTDHISPAGAIRPDSPAVACTAEVALVQNPDRSVGIGGANPLEWIQQAACKGKTGPFFSRYVEDLARARVLCAGCPVRAECLEYDLLFAAHFFRHGDNNTITLDRSS